MKEEHKDRGPKLNRQDIKFLIELLAITISFHGFFLVISKGSSVDLSNFLERSNAALDGKISYRDDPLLSDPKPLWTYVLAFWLFFCRSTIGLIFDLENTHSYDEIYAKLLIIIANLMLVVVIFCASRDLFSPRAAYFASSFYAINFFPLILCSAAGKYDVIPALFIVIATWMAAKSKIKSSAAFLGVGTSFKFIAGLPLPIILIFLSKQEKGLKPVLIYLTIYGTTCLAIAAPFLLINAERFIDSTVFFFLERKTHGPHSILHPLYLVPHQFLILLPVTLITLTCLYAIRKEEMSNYDLIMLLFIVTAIFCFTNKAFLPQYFLYLIPYLAMVFPNIFPGEGRRKSKMGNPFLAASAIFIPNFFALSLAGYFFTQHATNFDSLFIHTIIDLNLLSIFDFTKRYDFVGVIDGRLFIICFILVLNLIISYLLETPKELQRTYLNSTVQ